MTTTRESVNSSEPSVRRRVSPRLARWVGVAAFSVLTLLPTLAGAQEAELDRIEAICVLAQQDTKAAFKDILALGAELGPTTPYVVQRQYLRTRFKL